MKTKASDKDIINIHEWNGFAEKRMTLLESLTFINNRYRCDIGELEDKLEKFRDAVKTAHDALLAVVNECNIYYKYSEDIADYTLDECCAAIDRIKQLNL